MFLRVLTDDLLCNVMLEKVAERLKLDKHTLLADTQEEVSVFFADLKGFTSWSDKKVEEIVHALDSLVQNFDQTVKAY